MCATPERGSCYGPFSYVASRTFFDSLTMRVLPSLLCAAITYPTVGLDHGAHGAVKAYAFTAALCLANLVGSTMFNCIGIVCSSTALAVLLAVLYALFTLLFCGFLVNVTAATGLFDPGRAPNIALLLLRATWASQPAAPLPHLYVAVDRPTASAVSDG